MMRWVRDRDGVMGHVAAALLVSAILIAGCGTATVNEVAAGTYLSLVPSIEQLGLDVDGELPGGVAQLRMDGVDRIEAAILSDQVTFRVDGIDTVTREIVERAQVTDSEGSGPFKAKKQILLLGDDPLVLGKLVIMDRSALPHLAPLTEATEGDWCTPSVECLLFVPT